MGIKTFFKNAFADMKESAQEQKKGIKSTNGCNQGRIQGTVGRSKGDG